MLSASVGSLDHLAKLKKDAYLKASPFPHIIFDDFFDSAILNQVLSDFPDLAKSDSSTIFSNSKENKLASSRGDIQQPESIKQLLRFLNSHEFIDFLQELTSISEPLIPDPHFMGGGLHEIKSGGLLKLHADFSKHPETRLDRRVNILIYLNKDWDESYGGQLQLWDHELTACHSSILPIFNRVVIFNTNDFTFHGHPDPLTCPEDRSRKSLALYYFSNGRPSSELSSDNNQPSTAFVDRPGESDVLPSHVRFKNLLIDFVPPIFVKATKKLIRKVQK